MPNIPHRDKLANLIAKKEKQLESDGFITFDQTDLQPLKKRMLRRLRNIFMVGQ